MAPGTNIGAAHPVNMQGGMDTTMSEKVTHDAAAFVRTIAQQRNRNMEWAEEAVRRSVSLTASEALDQNVIDYVASDLGDLLNQADGKEVETPGGVVTLSTSNITLEEIPMSSIEEFLNILSNPNIAYLLLMFGFYGVLFELYNPGAILPGIIGVIGFILGFYSLNTLPLNYAGLALIIFGIILFILEIKITSYGMLSIGGIISLGLGSAMLIRPEMGFQFPGIATSVIVTTTLATAAFFIFVVGMGLRAQRAKPVTNREGFMDETGVTVDVLDPRGNVMIHGELWQAESASGLIPADTKVRVTGRKHFTLFVELLDKT
jgi:membrane-bound serine protease (ClpP class)